MSVQRPNSKNTASIATPWPLGADWWVPAMSGCAAANGNLHQSYLDLSVEWQSFLAHRISEDFHLMQELSAAKAPDQVWNAWSTFWQKSAGDYGREYSIMAKLAAGFLPNNAPVNQDTSGGGTLIGQPQSKAA
jgi:hypothetical protein